MEIVNEDKTTVGYEESELLMFKHNELPVLVEHTQSVNMREVKLMNVEESATADWKESAPPLPPEHVQFVNVALASTRDMNDTDATESAAPFP